MEIFESREFFFMRKFYAIVIFCILLFVTVVGAAEKQITIEGVVDAGSMIATAVTSGQIPFVFF
jgi:hypothetical protein